MIESLRCGSRRFDHHTAGLHQAMVSTDCVTVQIAPWLINSAINIVISYLNCEIPASLQ